MVHVYPQIKVIAGTGALPRLQWVASWKDGESMSRQPFLTKTAGCLNFTQGLHVVVHANTGKMPGLERSILSSNFVYS
jgi:hypothetical protein